MKKAGVWSISIVESHCSSDTWAFSPTSDFRGRIEPTNDSKVHQVFETTMMPTVGAWGGIGLILYLHSLVFIRTVSPNEKIIMMILAKFASQFW